MKQTGWASHTSAASHGRCRRSSVILYINLRETGRGFCTAPKQKQSHGRLLKILVRPRNSILNILLFAHASCENTHVLCGGKRDGTTWARWTSGQTGVGELVFLWLHPLRSSTDTTPSCRFERGRARELSLLSCMHYHDVCSPQRSNPLSSSFFLTITTALLLVDASSQPLHWRGMIKRVQAGVLMQYMTFYTIVGYAKARPPPASLWIACHIIILP